MVEAVPLVISSSALAFTVGSFWWLQARRGRLIVFEPHTFAAYVQGRERLLIRLPLVLHNTGPVPIVVQSMRLTFPYEPDQPVSLPWTNTRKQLDPNAGDVEDLPAVFAVPGRNVLQRFVEFGGAFPGLVPEPRRYVSRVEAKLGHKGKWVSILSFDLHAQNMLHPDAYITYTNDPTHHTADELAAGRMNGQRLREQLLPPNANQ